MATNINTRSEFSIGHSTPPDSPLPDSRASSPEGQSHRPTSSSSSLDRLPPAMSAHGTTPAPSDDHTDMVAHTAEIHLDDDDDDGHDEHGTLNDHHSRLRQHYSYPGPSRPSTPPIPPTVATALHHHFPPFSPSLSSPGSVSEAGSSPGGPLSAALSPAHTYHGETHHGHSLSPFSLFNHGHSHANDTGTSKILKIELTHPEIVLMNEQTTVLEGVVYVNPHKNIKVKTLQLEFSGRTSVTWVDDNAYSPATRHSTAPHIEHTWNLISHQHKQPPTLLQPGQHAFPFSLELPDSLPESVTTIHGKVAYRLTATLTKPGLSFNSSTATLPVTVHRRYTAPASRVYQRGGRAVSSPDDKIKYKVTMPQTRVPHSTKIPLQVSITAPTANVHIQVLQVGLWERVVYRADGRKRVDMRLVKIQKSEGWERPQNHDTEAWNWNKVLLFDMPHLGSELNQCNPSADNGLMKVGHILRFTILGTDGTKRFRVENEIGLKVLAYEDVFNPESNGPGDGVDPELPSYLTSFSTPRVSLDSEREMDPVDDDLLRSTVHRIHLPTYAESEEEANSRATSRDVSRSTSRNASRNASPERSLSTGSLGHPHHLHLHHHHHNHHLHHSLTHPPSSFNPLNVGHAPIPNTAPLSPSPLGATEPTVASIPEDEPGPDADVPAGDEVTLPPPVHHHSPGRNSIQQLSRPNGEDHAIGNGLRSSSPPFSRGKE